MAADILFVDDDETLLGALWRCFRRELRIAVSDNPETALEFFEAPDAPKVVVSDFRMPEMTGVEFLRHVAQRAPDTERLILTAYTSEVNFRKAIDDGTVHCVLEKPCPFDTLRQCLQVAIGNYGRHEGGYPQVEESIR